MFALLTLVFAFDKAAQCNKICTEYKADPSTAGTEVVCEPNRAKWPALPTAPGPMCRITVVADQAKHPDCRFVQTMLPLGCKLYTRDITREGGELQATCEFDFDQTMKAEGKDVKPCLDWKEEPTVMVEPAFMQKDPETCTPGGCYHGCCGGYDYCCPSGCEAGCEQGRTGHNYCGKDGCQKLCCAANKACCDPSLLV